MPTVDEQILIAEASLKYLKHPDALKVEQPENMLNLMEKGVLEFAGPNEDEPIFEHENGEQYYKVITDRFMLQSVYGVVSFCKKEELGIDETKADEFLKGVANQITLIKLQREVARTSREKALVASMNRSDRRKFMPKKEKKAGAFAFL